MTIGKYLNKTEKNYWKYGFLAKYYHILGQIFRYKKYLDKAVYYLDRRWVMAMALLSEHASK